ncbi:MAG TPA: DinB family protein [Gemmatimonadaceae bacterium]|nr:DinB family protein [Gemmatimonadaceae bacterium]
MNSTSSEGERIALELTQALNGDAWHGPSLREILDGVTMEEAMQRPIPAAHNIWEIVLHITSWVNITNRRITGGQVEPFENEDWPHTGPFAEDNWNAARNALIESHERLVEIVAGLSDDELARNVPKGERSVSNMLHGLVQHDAYHGGQISILKKSVTRHHRRTAL